MDERLSQGLLASLLGLAGVFVVILLFYATTVLLERAARRCAARPGTPPAPADGTRPARPPSA